MIGEEVIAIWDDGIDGAELYEVQKLVRCKDCKHNPKYTDDYMYGRCVFCCEDDYYSVEPDDDFYCGYGERKGE